MSEGTMQHQLAYSAPDAAKAIGVSESTIHRAITAGELSICKIGTRTVIPAWAIESFLRSKEVRKTKATA